MQYYCLSNVLLVSGVCICSVDRSIDYLLRKWNLQCENVPLSQLNAVQVFDKAAQSEFQHDDRSFQMLVITRPST